MRYTGSKLRYRKRIIKKIYENGGTHRWYIEPFLGGANVLPFVEVDKRVGADAHEYLMAMWQAAQLGWVPPTEVSKEMYEAIKADKDSYPPYLAGFVGFGCSFMNNWFGSYCPDNDSINLAQSSRSVTKTAHKLVGAHLSHSQYNHLYIPPNSIIYCDPPYQSIRWDRYKAPLNHVDFFQWCRDMQGAGHDVYISEYTVPDDFKCILEMEKKSYSYGRNKSSTPKTERLFTPA